MNLGFQETAVHRISGPVAEGFADELLGAIHGNTDWKYSCVQSGEGYLLQPTFRDMPYRNSFVPEIAVTVLQADGQLQLEMKGQPVKIIRMFMRFWFGFLLLMEVLLLIGAVVSLLRNGGALSLAEEVLFALVPVFMCVFGYLLCKIATRATFRSVVNAIRKGLS